MLRILSFLFEIFIIVIIQFLGVNFFSKYNLGSCFDLITPYIVYQIITKNQSYTFFIILFLSLLLETHTSFPRGFYFVSYGCLWLALYSIKDNISWQMIFPWFVIFIASQLWMSFFEGLVAFLLSNNVVNFTLTHFFSIVIKVFFSLVIMSYLILNKQRTTSQGV